MAWRAHVFRSMKDLRSLHRPSSLVTHQMWASEGLKNPINSKTTFIIREYRNVLTQQPIGYVSSFRLHPEDCLRSFSTGISNLPVISDPDIKAATKELMSLGWNEIPNSIIKDVKKALAKDTDDKAGHKALSDVFRAAEASVEFTAVLVNIRMALEERTGLTGENVTDLPEELVNAITVAYKRYMAYVHSFGPDESYLRKKVEAELGTRLIHLKQRISGLGSEWGEINLIGTSGLAGSYIEQRA